MPRAYSIDLRRRVIEAVETEASGREAAELFGIDPSSAIRWLQCWKDTGRCAPKPHRGNVSPLEEFSEEILALVAEQPDLTLEETVVELGKRRIRTSKSAVSQFFQRHFMSPDPSDKRRALLFDDFCNKILRDRPSRTTRHVGEGPYSLRLLHRKRVADALKRPPTFWGFCIAIFMTNLKLARPQFHHNYKRY